MAQQMSIQTEELRELRETSGKEGGGGRCNKCGQMQDELTRNLREKADDKQQIIKLENDVRKLQGQLAKAEAATDDALAKFVECNFSGANLFRDDNNTILPYARHLQFPRTAAVCHRKRRQNCRYASKHPGENHDEMHHASGDIWHLIMCALMTHDVRTKHVPSVGHGGHEAVIILVSSCCNNDDSLSVPGAYGGGGVANNRAGRASTTAATSTRRKSAARLPTPHHQGGHRRHADDHDDDEDAVGASKCDADGGT